MDEAPAANVAAVRPCAVVPVYNHPTTLSAVVAGLRAHDLPVILVDDASDRCCAAAIDADGQHDRRAIGPALACLRAHPNRLILGRPRFDSSMPRARRVGRRLTHGLVWLETLSLAIRDAMCGFRIYQLDQLIALADRRALGARMDFDIEVCVRLSWAGVGIEPVAVGVHYPADGISHFRLWDDNRRIAVMHVCLLGGMLVRLPWLIFRKVSTVD